MVDRDHPLAIGLPADHRRTRTGCAYRRSAQLAQPHRPIADHEGSRTRREHLYGTHPDRRLERHEVGEPFAAQTLMSGSADLLFYAENIWPGFICNLMLIRQDLIQNDENTVRYLVEGTVRSGLWAQRNLSQAAAIASRYWGQPLDLVEYALNTPEGRIVYDQYVPIRNELQQMADLMLQFNLSASADIEGLVDDRFARRANTDEIDDDVGSIFRK